MKFRLESVWNDFGGCQITLRLSLNLRWRVMKFRLESVWNDFGGCQITLRLSCSLIVVCIHLLSDNKSHFFDLCLFFPHLKICPSDPFLSILLFLGIGLSNFQPILDGLVL